MKKITHRDLFDEQSDYKNNALNLYQSQIANALTDSASKLDILLKEHEHELIIRFTEIVWDYREQFEQLKRSDRITFSQETLAILRDAFSLWITAPQLVFKKDNPISRHTRAMFSDFDNTITLFESTCPKNHDELFGILVHEFNHFLQFREQIMSEGIGIEWVIEACGERMASQHPFIQHVDGKIMAANTAIQIFYQHNGDLALNTKALLEQMKHWILAQHQKDSDQRLRAQAYNENKKNYISKQESLDKKWDFSLYKEQLLERESYAVWDALEKIFRSYFLQSTAK